MATLAETGAEMLVWLQIAKLTDKKIGGVGADVHDFAVSRIKELVDAARFRR